MKSKIYVLEDAPIVIMLYELWCKKFSLPMSLYKNAKVFLKDELPNKNDYCLLDVNLLTKNELVVLELMQMTNCLLTSNDINSMKLLYQLPVYSKIKALELLENLLFSREAHRNTISL